MRVVPMKICKLSFVYGAQAKHLRTYACMYGFRLTLQNCNPAKGMSPVVKIAISYTSKRTPVWSFVLQKHFPVISHSILSYVSSLVMSRFGSAGHDTCAVCYTARALRLATPYCVSVPCQQVPHLNY